MKWLNVLIQTRRILFGRVQGWLGSVINRTPFRFSPPSHTLLLASSPARHLEKASNKRQWMFATVIAFDRLQSSPVPYYLVFDVTTPGAFSSCEDNEIDVWVSEVSEWSLAVFCFLALKANGFKTCRVFALTGLPPVSNPSSAAMTMMT
jgi:hypothetical protein